MGKFNEFFLMNTEDVKQYAVEILKKFEPDEELESVEIATSTMCSESGQKKTGALLW